MSSVALLSLRRPEIRNNTTLGARPPQQRNIRCPAVDECGVSADRLSCRSIARTYQPLSVCDESSATLRGRRREAPKSPCEPSPKRGQALKPLVLTEQLPQECAHSIHIELPGFGHRLEIGPVLRAVEEGFEHGQ